MANIEEAIRRLKYLYETHGAEEVARAQAAITASTESTERASLSLEKSFNNLERRYVATVRAQQNYQKDLEKVNAALAQNPALQQRANVVMEHMAQQYIATSRGMQAYGTAMNKGTGEARLARHELINLSRQIQDVGVGLASGQSPFTILVQQGSQIADVFATSTGTIGGFFRQAGAGAARFLGSAAGIGTAVATMGASIVYAAVQYGAAQRDIEKALSGIGAASGVTRDQINQIASASSTAFGASTAQAREAATAFAATGKASAETVAQATKLFDSFVRGGADAAEVTKQLAAAFENPAAAAVEFNKKLGFLDATTLNYIRSLQAQGKTQEAVGALFTAMGPKVQQQEKYVGGLAAMWNAATNALSNYFDHLGKVARRDLERATGVSAGGFSEEEQLQRAQQRLQSFPYAGAMAQPTLKALREEIERLQKAIAATAAAAAQSNLAQLGRQADDAARSFLPMRAEIDKTLEALAKLQQFQAAGGAVDPGVIAVGQVRTQQLQEQEASLGRQAQKTQEIAAQYPGMSSEVAKQLSAAEDQLRVVSARSDGEQRAAQEIATQNQYLMQGLSLEEAIALAAAQRANAEAQAAAQSEKANAQKAKALQSQLESLQDQAKMIRAVTDGTEKSTAAAIAYRKAIKEGASEAFAARIAAAQADVYSAREEQQAHRQKMQDEEALMQRKRQAADAQAQANAAQNAANAQIIAQYNELVAKIGFASVGMATLFRAGAGYKLYYDRFGDTQMWTTPSGKWSAFDPAGYGQTPTAAAEQLMLAQQKYGVGGFGTPEGGLNVYGGVNIEANQQGVTAIVDKYLGKGGPIQGAIASALAEGDVGIGVAQQLIGVLPKEQQASAIQQVLSQVKAMPRTLASEQLIAQLTQQLEGLKNSTDSLNATMQNALSPYYSQDPRTTRLGFRAGVVANPDWFAAGASNQSPLAAILGAGATAPSTAGVKLPEGYGQGFAGGGSFIVGGGYSANDNRLAQFPVASGEQVIVNRRPQDAGSKPTVINQDNRIIIQGSVGDDTLSKLKVSRYQQAQRMRSSVGG